MANSIEDIERKFALATLAALCPSPGDDEVLSPASWLQSFVQAVEESPEAMKAYLGEDPESALLCLSEAKALATKLRAISRTLAPEYRTARIRKCVETAANRYGVPVPTIVDLEDILKGDNETLALAFDATMPAPVEQVIAQAVSAELASIGERAFKIEFSGNESAPRP